MTRQIINKLTGPSSLKRFLFFFCADIILIVTSLFLSFLFHFDFDLNAVYVGLVVEVIPYFVVVKLISFGVFRIYRMTWRYVGIFDLVNIVGALIVSGMVLIILSLPTSLLPGLGITGFPKRIILEDSIISIFLIAGLRISKRLYMEVIHKQRPARQAKRALILGAGNTGEMIVRDMARVNFSEFYPVGFLDDDKTRIGTYIHGVKVFGTTETLREIILKHDIDTMIIAIPSLNHKNLKQIYDTAKKANVGTIKIVPRIYNFDKPDVNMKGLEDISIEDLVGRQSVAINYKDIGDFINSKSVLITGAGGSIGSEIVYQVCAFAPGNVIIFDIDETELHNLGLKIARSSPQLSEKIHYKTGDVRDEARLSEVFEEFKPQIVFHAAAYKHVPMMEFNPKEAVKVNMLGTYALAKTARKYGVDKFILISTDKAVRPTSVMGATKRMAENVCKAMNEENVQRSTFNVQRSSESNAYSPTQPFNHEVKSEELGVRSEPISPTHPLTHSTRFISVRFGNVLGSRGSVLPLFLDQLKYGGPLTVTHRDMKRYFMTIPEAVSLVLQASAMGVGGEVFVLDMGEPVNITDVAEELIRIHGLEPYKDIDIIFTGLRPGEKLFEEILTAEEGTDASKHEKVFIARNSEKYSLDEIKGILNEFREVLSNNGQGSDDLVRELLRKYVKHYEETGGGEQLSRVSKFSEASKEGQR
ncbi:MAG: polysaccharide biosynthesis protein [Syntrophus sp. (in: bacteria)]|nr:polysaccharide biosynthesis protein [Syntrophus sp. (in: bacteria)]MBA4418579.1 polysaccharide biosynthesis protein [Syntrophus sp. (in: bacteria)]